LPAIGAGGAVTFIMQAVNDLWTRDTAPVFVVGDDKKLSAVNFNFNGWGQENTGAAGWVRDPNKAKNGIQVQPINEDRKVADFVIAQTAATKVSTWLVMEGGGVEVNGKGTAICTESCILNTNRNPNKTKADVEAELLRVLGVKKVIWLTGSKAKDITDGHIDFYARFVGDSTVVYTLDNDTESPDFQPTHDNKAVLEAATDANGTKITAIALVSPDTTQVKTSVLARNSATANFSFNAEAFAAGYVGFYLANNCVLMAGFGDAAADALAYNQLKMQYPLRTIIQITTDGLANGGGTIHCATQQQIVVA
jgi:agmatine deiminase